jgi:hypothetical protein
VEEGEVAMTEMVAVTLGIGRKMMANGEILEVGIQVREVEEAFEDVVEEEVVVAVIQLVSRGRIIRLKKMVNIMVTHQKKFIFLQSIHTMKMKC